MRGYGDGSRYDLLFDSTHMRGRCLDIVSIARDRYLFLFWRARARGQKPSLLGSVRSGRKERACATRQRP